MAGAVTRRLAAAREWQCALLGGNGDGQLGNGTMAPSVEMASSAVPVAVVGLP